MNRQEILNMVAGKELNQLIASKIFKYELDESRTRFRISCNKVSWLSIIPSYSESMDSAMLIVELFRKNAIYINIETNELVYVVSAYSPDCAEYMEVLTGDSLPLLICKVALLCNTYDFVNLEV